MSECPDTIYYSCGFVCFVCTSANFVRTGVTPDCRPAAHFFRCVTGMGPNGFDDSGTACANACVNHIDKVNFAVLVVVVLRKIDAVPS